jgi:photosystem II stability/assembly factor-like uncharacterized protein
MCRVKAVYLTLVLVFCSSLTVFGQWSPINSGTTNNLNGVYLLDSGTGFAVGDTGTILKTTDLGATWAPLTSGITTILAPTVARSLRFHRVRALPGFMLFRCW